MIHQWQSQLLKLIKQSLALRLFLLMVGLPVLLASIYYAFIASGIYTSEAKYAVRTSSDLAQVGILNAVLPLGSIGSVSEDAAIIRDYVLSRDMLEKLDNRLQLKKHFQSKDVDFYSRLDSDATIEDTLEYYRGMVSIGIDPSTNIITLQTRAFSPEVARAMAQTIIELSENLVNKLSDRIVNDTLSFAREEVERAEMRVRKASDALTRFRSESQSIDPGEETNAVLEIVTKLETELAKSRAELIQASSFMQSDSPRIKVLRSKVEAIERQVQEERKRLTSGENTTTDYTKLIDKYTPLILEQQLSKQRYASALTSLEAARIEAQRKQRYLISFVEPDLPDEALIPRKTKSVFVIFLALSLIYGIGGLVWAAIKDHMRL